MPERFGASVNRLGLSVPVFADAVVAGNPVDERLPADRSAAVRLPDGEAGTGTLHIDSDGVVFACSSGAASLLGREIRELVGDVIWHLVPALEGRRLISESRVDPHLAFLCHCGVSFRVLRPDGTSKPCRMFLHSLTRDGEPALRLMLRDDSERANICL